MDQHVLKEGTHKFALQVIRLVEQLPRGRTADVLAKQLLRSATSIGANYRAACRARSRAEFIAKMGIVEEEADESAYWIELLIDTGIVQQHEARMLLDEAHQLVAIAVSSIRTARRNRRK